MRTRGRFDYLGAVLLSIALTALLLAISKGGAWGWGSEPVIVLFVVAVGGAGGLGALRAEGRPAAGRPAHLGPRDRCC